MAHAAEYINFRSCCRLCLTERSALNNIFSARNRPLDVAAKIFSVIGIKVTSQDRITTSLCDKCLLHVNNYDNFKNDCLINQVQLAKQLSIFEAQLIDESVVIKDEPIDEDDVVCVSPDRCSPPTIKTENLGATDDLPPILSPNYPTEEMLRNLEVQTIEEVEADPALIDMNGHEEHDAHEANESQSEDAEAEPEPEPAPSQADDASAVPPEAEDSAATTTDASEKQDPRDKIAFAATLNLAKKMNDINMEPFTRTEEQYNLRMRIIYSQLKTLVCSCHKKQMSTMKAMLGHIKKYDGVYLPPFTCANCVTTFSRSHFGKHRALACKMAPYESMHDVSNAVERGVNKHRNYQAFKCMLCSSSARLFEHFLQHVNDHIAIDPTLTCHCDRSFASASSFRQHMLGPCVMRPSCDMCDKTFETADEFRAHCADVHDDAEGEQFALADAYEPDALPFVALYACVECNLKCKQEMFIVRHLETAHGYDGEAAKRVGEDCYIGPAEGGAQNGADDGDAEPSEDANNLNNNVSEAPPSGGAGKPPKGDELFMSSAIRQLDPSTFECQVCFKTFGYVANVRRHIHQQHLNTAMAKRASTFSCGNCAAHFQTMPLLQEHLMTVHFHTCRDCGVKCDGAEELDKHRSGHLKISLTRDPKTHSYRRSDAGDEMPMLVPVDQDIKSMTAQCKLCKRYFATTRGLSVHIKCKHKDAVLHRDALTKFPQLCRRKGCHVLLKSVPDWSLHMQMHAEADAAESSTGSSPVRPDDTDYYTCRRCFKVFSNRGNLKQHMKSHGSKTPSPKAKKHQCQICKLDCGSLEKLAVHKQTHMPKASGSVCKVCKVGFGDEDALAAHTLAEHDAAARTKAKAAAARNNGTFDCNICGKQLPSSESLRGHIGWHKRTGQQQLRSAKAKPSNAISVDAQKLFKTLTFYCICCGDLLPTQEALQEHQARAHAKLRCHACGKFFRHAAELSEHMRTAHVKPEPAAAKRRQASPHADGLKKAKTGYEYCKICGEEFNAEAQLREHMLERHPSVPYVPKGSCVCPVCADEFRNSAALASHLRMHTRRGETVQHPQGAPAFASKRASLAAASNSVPAAAAATPPPSAAKQFKFNCGICQKGYNLGGDLRRHILESHPF